MYEHPIKRAGISLNRIIYSNTKMVMQGFPNNRPQQFNLSFKFKTYSDGRLQSTKCKSSILTLYVCALTEVQIMAKSTKTSIARFSNLCVFASISSLHRCRSRRCPPRQKDHHQLSPTIYYEASTFQTTQIG